MDHSQWLADDTIAKIEAYYPQFLLESEVKDSSLIRYAFYHAFWSAAEDNPMTDARAQELVRSWLKSKLTDTSTKLFEEILHDFDL